LAAKSTRANIGSLASRAVCAPLGGNVSLKTVLGWLAVAFIVWWIIEEPAAAAHVVHNIGTFLTTVASGLSSFFSSI
jgi:hypothetical protein